MLDGNWFGFRRPSSARPLGSLPVRPPTNQTQTHMPSSNYFKSSKVESFMTKLGAEELAEGICRMEGVRCVTFSVLYNLGMGTDCGMRAGHRLRPA